MGCRVEEESINEDKVYILLGRRCGDRLLWRFMGRGNISGVSEGNFEILVGNKKEEIPLTHRDDIKGEVQGQEHIEVAHVAVI